MSINLKKMKVYCVQNERDEALRLLQDSRPDSRLERSSSFDETANVIVDHWSTHSFNVMLVGYLSLIIDDDAKYWLSIFISAFKR